MARSIDVREGTAVALAESPTASATSKGSSKPSESVKEGYRETVEAIVVAFILALVFKGFAAEAFVIPTGSMAPTLMGRHKEVTCPECGYVYRVNASEEVEGSSSGTRRVFSGICENCRFQAKVVDEPSFKGDRILVMKFLYDLAFLPAANGPERWDVVVFRYPEEPEVSYIKRLIGLPGETLRIWYGDVFIKKPGEGEFRLERKPLRHQNAMQMMVYDDGHRAKALKGRPEWARWSSEGGTFREGEAGEYRADGSGTEWSSLTYRHLAPDPEQWNAISAGEPLARGPAPTLITDFYSYNTNLTVDHSDLTADVSRDHESAWLQPHWVGDLTVSGRLKTEGSSGTARFELVEGGVVNRCEVDLASGEARLFRQGTEVAKAPSLMKGAGDWGWSFANVDNRLTVLVDGKGVFGEGILYGDEGETHPEPTSADLAPVRLAVKGTKATLSGLVLKRDIYYTLTPGGLDYGNSWDARLPKNPTELSAFLAEPEKVAALGPLAWNDYPIGNDRFMMFGDNSPRSKDGRGWGYADSSWDPGGREKWEVPRNLITGKAFCVYWPHGKPFGPDLKISPDFRVPFRPYFERMKLIR